MKRLLVLLLVIVTAFSSFACNPTTDGSVEEPPKANGVINDIDRHYYEGGIHKYNMTTTDLVFAINNQTEYKIVLPNDAIASDRSGASYISRFVEEAMGAAIETVSESDVTYTDESKFIVFNCPDIFATASFTPTTENIGDNGYQIKSVGNSVFIYTTDREIGFGARNAGLEFLRLTIGLEFFDGESYSYNCKPGDKVMLPGFDVIDAPDIEWMMWSSNVSSATKTALRGSEAGDIFMNPEGGSTYHNTLQWLPVEEASAEQKEYWYNTDKTELCYTAHGNEEMLDEMIRRCIAKAIVSVDNNPDRKVLTFTVMDGGHYCNCESCTASKLAYGGADSAAHIKFVNRIGKGLDEYLTQKASDEGKEKRDVDLIFFAYNQTNVPPVKEVNGEIVPYDDSVVLYDNVGVFFAPIGMQYNESLYADVNASFLRSTNGWGALTDQIYVWYYSTNFSNYLYPFPTWHTIGDSYGALAEAGALYIYNQGQYNQGQGGVTGFHVFKEYLNHQFRWDCNQSYYDLTNRFFKGYFKEAEKPMRRYFDELTAHIEYLEDEYPTAVHGSIYHYPTEGRFWPQRTLKQWLGYLDEAYECIEPLKDTDPAKYGVLYKNILKESIFLRYAMLTIYQGTFSSEELYNERVAFKNDCMQVGIARVNEGGLLSAVYSTWGI